MESTQNSTTTNKAEEVLPLKDSELTKEFLVTYVKIHKLDAEEVAKILQEKMFSMFQL